MHDGVDPSWEEVQTQKCHRIETLRSDLSKRRKEDLAEIHRAVKGLVKEKLPTLTQQAGELQRILQDYETGVQNWRHVVSSQLDAALRRQEASSSASVDAARRRIEEAADALSRRCHARLEALASDVASAIVECETAVQALCVKPGTA